METLQLKMGHHLVYEIPTRWGSHLNGNKHLDRLAPNHSVIPTRWGSHLNGNTQYATAFVEFDLDPYSLGISLEWKPLDNAGLVLLAVHPYSLGISLEWKPDCDWLRLIQVVDVIPTRWGSHLNGNWKILQLFGIEAIY
jgi:hypothetical protein